MTSYVKVDAEQIPAGKSALLLFIAHDQLCAGILEHRQDGQLDRRIPDDPVPTDVVPIICQLMARQGDEALYVVLEPAAYWPEAFPSLLQ